MVVGEVVLQALTSEGVDELHRNLALTLGQQLVADPIFVCKVALAAFVGVVFAEHALWHIAPVVPAAQHMAELSYWRVILYTG